MSEQLKQELEADTDRLETETVAGSETIGKQEKDAVEGKLESQEGIECIQKNTPYKTDFRLPITCTRICSKMYTRIIYQRIFIYKTTYKELAKSLLHIFN